MSRKVVASVAALSLAAFAGPAVAQTRPAVASPQLGSPEATVAEFLSAFNALDKNRFDRTFAADATVFFPQHPFPIRRVQGQDVLTWFHRFIDARAGKPQSIEPRDLAIKSWGDTAIATFHLGASENAAGRRTLVLRREGASWKIVHLHASGSSKPEEPAERG